MNGEGEKVTREETTVERPDGTTEEKTVENPSETTTREETTVEKPVLNDPEDLARMAPGAPQAVERETTVTETETREEGNNSEG